MLFFQLFELEGIVGQRRYFPVYTLTGGLFIRLELSLLDSSLFEFARSK